MRSRCCHTFLASFLKFLNFMQAFVGVAIIVYSAYLLNRWNKPESGANAIAIAPPFRDFSIRFDLHSLPPPWIIYAFMGIGILICCINFIGNIGAEAVNSCCLCLYAILTILFIILELVLVTFITFDQSWDKDIPFDPTGELDTLRTFIQHNVDIFKWVGIAVVATQVLSLLIAIILRSMVSREGIDDDDDIDNDYNIRANIREPFLNAYSNANKGDSDIWSSRMRVKYGLSSDGKHNTLDQNSSPNAKS